MEVRLIIIGSSTFSAYHSKFWVKVLTNTLLIDCAQRRKQNIYSSNQSIYFTYNIISHLPSCFFLLFKITGTIDISCVCPSVTIPAPIQLFSTICFMFFQQNFPPHYHRTVCVCVVCISYTCLCVHLRSFLRSLN